MDKAFIEYNFPTRYTASTVVDADATSATVCWPYSATVRDCGDGQCHEYIKQGNLCENIKISPYTDCTNTSSNVINGHIIWNGKTLHYRITQKPPICDEACGDTSIRYSEVITSWLNYPVVKCDDSDTKRTLFYTYKKIESDDCGISNIGYITESTEVYLDNGGEIQESKTGTTNITINGVNYPLDYSYTYYPCKECEKNKPYINIYNVNYRTDTVPFNGGNVDYDIYYNVVRYDKDCQEIINSFIKSGTWEIPPCCDGDSCSNSATCIGSCCNDHTIISSTTISYEYEEDDVTYTLTTSIKLSCLMTQDYNGDLCAACKKETCSVDVKYYTNDNVEGDVVGETYYEVYDSALENYLWKKDDSLFVSSSGGKIKVTFPYTAITRNVDCTSSATYGIGENIIIIPPSECCSWDSCSGVISGGGSFNYLICAEGKSNKVSYIYNQYVEKCEEEPQPIVVNARMYYDPESYPCSQTGNTEVPIQYKDFKYKYDNHGNLISTEEVGSGIINVNIYFGNYQNTEGRRIVSSITEYNVSIYQKGGNEDEDNKCEREELSALTFNDLELKQNGNEYYYEYILECNDTGEREIMLPYTYYIYSKDYNSNLLIRDMIETTATILLPPLEINTSENYIDVEYSVVEAPFDDTDRTFKHIKEIDIYGIITTIVDCSLIIKQKGGCEE